jgi:hypothetical protein
MGPKYEHYNFTNPQKISPLNHIDVSAGIYVGKYFNENWSAELGLIKNDYSSKFSLVTDDGNFFDGFVFPTLNTYQAALLAGYNKRYSEKVTFYSKLGVQFFLNRKLNSKGANEIGENKVDQDGNITSTATLVTYRNTLGPSNILGRLDLGLYYWVNENLALDISVLAKGSTLEVNSYGLNYTYDNVTVENIFASTKGSSIQLNFGIMYSITSKH